MLWVPLLVALAMVLGLSIFYYYSPPSRREAISFFGTGVGLTAALAGAIFTYQQVGEAAKQSRMAADQIARALVHDQQAAAFDLIEKYDGLPLRLTSKFVRSVKGKTPEEINDLQNADPESAEALRTSMNFFEHTALSIRTGYASESVACEHFRDTGVFYYDTLDDFIQEFRRQTQSPDAWKHYQWLYEKWKAGCPPVETSNAE